MAEEKTRDKDGLLNDLDINFDTQFDPDKALGLATSAIQPKGVDNTAIDKEIAALEKPSGGSVYDKMAARYRSQGEAKALRTQKNLNNLFSPTITLIKEREANAQARFTLLKDKMPEFDDSTIFGNQSGNEMPIKDYVMGVSKSVKEDLRMLSRLNINDERYDEVKKRVEKNQEAIVNFDEINKKLLEIRNSQDGREDHTQWSKGMDQTTIDMWTDIYSSKGENIKIVDGKLVWTDTTGESSYEFKGGSFIDDKWEALGKDDTDLGYLASSTRDDAGNQYTFENGDKGNRVKDVQEALINGGFTDTDGNELDADGEWGNKSQAAYDKYLEQKDGLEKAYLDEIYEGDAKKTSGTGGTKTIDLSQIGEGPTLIDNKGTNMDIALRGETQKFIEMGGKVDDPMYNQMIKSKLFELNKIGPQGLKSLIFDGVGLDDKDMFTGSNTDSFIEKVIADTYADGDISKLSEKEIEGYIQEMKSGDVTLDYNDGEGGTASLQSLFMKWYKGEVDKKITEGKKSKVVRSATGGGGGNYRGSNNQSRSVDLSKTGLNLTFGARNTAKYNYSNKTANGYPLEDGEVALTGGDLREKTKGIESLKGHLDYREVIGDDSFVINNDNEIVRVDKDGRYFSFADPVNSMDPKDALAYNAIMEAVRLKIEEQGGIFEFKEAAEWSYISTRAEEYRKKMGDAIGDTILEQMQDRSNDHWKYWNEDIKYDSDGNEVTSTYADEIRDDEFTD